MESKQFPYYIEDWILWLARRRDPLGNEIDFPYYRAWPVKLANYDVVFITRSADTILKGSGFTDRQVETAVKIVTKYQKQIFNQLGKDTDYLLESAPTRLKIRDVDRSHSIQIVNNQFQVRFPYNPKLVDSMHNSYVDAAGEFRWHAAQRMWIVDCTERNLAILRDFVKNHNFQSWELDSLVTQWFGEVDAIRANTYNFIPTLELTHNNCLSVINTNPHLQTALKDFDFNSNIGNAVFCAASYGLQIGPRLTDYVKNQFPNIANALLSSQDKILTDSKRLVSQLNPLNISEFMQTVAADRWIFVNFDRSAQTKGIAKVVDGADVSGEKIFIDVSVSSVVKDMDQLFDKNAIVITDNSMLTNRLWPVLLSKNILRLIYVRGG